ncbi:signal peptidase complex-like protein DTM1 isoform X2 [Carica papaya]|uniref:signal peptidase complex-like protein DTM1 isoform X2 n=1 Tax=Carica papaya TaxID=3649 RepID=UPI000B8CACE2|nr:signal peptidase complex-like protein DTM1 isoform X2 [Carica papaya]
MASDTALRLSMVWLAAVIVVVGIWTQSLKKMMVTYVVGMLGIGGVLLPDWDFFDRDFSRWCSPVTADEREAALAQRSGLRSNFSRSSSLRLVAILPLY